MKRFPWFHVCALALAFWTVPVSAQEGSIDVMGAWTISFSSSQGSVTLDARLTQEGTTLRGETGSALGYRTSFGEGHIEGAVLSFDVDVEVDGAWYPLYFDGELEGEEIKGRVDIPDGTRASFTARRQEGA